MKILLVIWFLKNDGVRTSAASAPRSAARRIASMVALVDSRPVPAISGRLRHTRARDLDHAVGLFVLELRRFAVGTEHDEPGERGRQSDGGDDC